MAALAVAAVACATSASNVVAEELRSAANKKTTLRSGRRIGERVPSFYVRAVTGPLENKSVCYVCRNGDRPVAMVFARKIVPELPRLLKGLDGLVDKHRARGLRSFGVFLTDMPRTMAPKLQTMSFDKMLLIPLTTATPSIGAPAYQNLHENAVVTIVLYRQQRVVASLAFREQELSKKRVRDVLGQVRKLVRGEETGG